jgi:hypothetical protein
VFPSIRVQLTPWLALLITLCLVAFAFYLYVAVGHTLTVNQDQVLRVQAQQVAATYSFDVPDSGDKEQDEQRVDASVGDQVATGLPAGSRRLTAAASRWRAPWAGAAPLPWCWCCLCATVAQGTIRSEGGWKSTAITRTVTS